MDSLKIILLLIVLINLNQNQIQCGYHDDGNEFKPKTMDELWSGTPTPNQQDNKSGQKVNMKIDQKFTQQKPSYPYQINKNYYSKLMPILSSPVDYSNYQSEDVNGDQDNGNQNNIEPINQMVFPNRRQQICKVKLIPFINLFCVHGFYSFRKLIII